MNSALGKEVFHWLGVMFFRLKEKHIIPQPTVSQTQETFSIKSEDPVRSLEVWVHDGKMCMRQ